MCFGNATYLDARFSVLFEVKMDYIHYCQHHLTITEQKYLIIYLDPSLYGIVTVPLETAITKAFETGFSLRSTCPTAKCN